MSSTSPRADTRLSSPNSLTTLYRSAEADHWNDLTIFCLKSVKGGWGIRCIYIFRSIISWNSSVIYIGWIRAHAWVVNIPSIMFTRQRRILLLNDFENISRHVVQMLCAKLIYYIWLYIWNTYMYILGCNWVRGDVHEVITIHIYHCCHILLNISRTECQSGQ